MREAFGRLWGAPHVKGGMSEQGSVWRSAGLPVPLVDFFPWSDVLVDGNMIRAQNVEVRDGPVRPDRVPSGEMPGPIPTYLGLTVPAID